jgi:hypothetical protein
LLGVGGLEIGLGAADELGKIVEVAAIGVEGIVAGALFGGQHVEEQAGKAGVGGVAAAHGASLTPIS